MAQNILGDSQRTHHDRVTAHRLVPPACFWLFSAVLHLSVSPPTCFCFFLSVSLALSPAAVQKAVRSRSHHHHHHHHLRADQNCDARSRTKDKLIGRDRSGGGGGALYQSGFSLTPPESVVSQLSAKLQKCAHLLTRTSYCRCTMNTELNMVVFIVVLCVRMCVYVVCVCVDQT